LALSSHDERDAVAESQGCITVEPTTHAGILFCDRQQTKNSIEPISERMLAVAGPEVVERVVARLEEQVTIGKGSFFRSFCRPG
jgi:hypothetical protein